MGEYKPVHELVAQRAAEAPDACAVTDTAGAITYADLVARADRLAETLIRSGLTPGDTVAVQLRRSGAAIVALLAVSRAGGGALMLDIDGPRRWLEGFVEIARPVAWLAHDGAPAPPYAGPVIYLGGDGTVTEVAPDLFTTGPEGPAIGTPYVGPEDLACLVQTSGTTGLPKLVQVPQRTWTTAARTQCQLHGIDASERGAWLFPAHTNVSVSVVVWPFLIAGGHLSVPPDDLIGAPAELVEWIAAERVTQCFAVAPLAEALAKQDWPPSALRLLLTGSDRVREWGRNDLPFEIGNWYGANEVNIVTSSVVPWEQRITSATAGRAERAGPPPIGRVWPGAQWRVVDPEGADVPEGRIGELLVGGDQLAIGYHSARKTAEKFTPDADAVYAGQRIYRTGDLVRVRDGVFEHCGRTDEQVKINGVRVEMGEVEAALLGCPGVREAAATAVETGTGRLQLVGYVVAEPGGTVDSAGLRGRLADLLPAHMVPVAYVRLDALPRNRGDKIDRRALPAPETSGAETSDALGGRVAAVFAGVLERESCAPDDNFFLLGGDSMRATRAARTLTSELGREVSVEQVIMHPTPRELSELIRS
ncbi:non-ribosomal peptide synthetase [Solicola gregarius]|uniref:Non-ribosomal peptide synthetase n=1 Tax=Solicola gregarius TaxID=2908642 RepID=A0AA46TEG0_9ACTN|nr:non-ribosomal peptide synthetase [Solicola gregarius]UYM03635.1 non-ribosomal peptide synthetase [Solicola gregarius]